MAVAAEECRAGTAEVLCVNWVAYTVPGRRVEDAELGRSLAEEPVVVGIPLVSLKEVVIYVNDARPGQDRVDPKCLQLEHGHCAADVLQQALVYVDVEQAARRHLARRHVAGKYLLGHRQTGHCTPSCRGNGPGACSAVIT